MTDTALTGDIHALTGRIGEARRLAALGEMIDAAALDREVAQLCERAAVADRALAEELRVALERLRGEVETLGETLDQRLSEMREALSGAQIRRQAVSAYGTKDPQRGRR